MSMISDAVSSVVQGGVNAVGRVGSVKRYKVNEGRFTDPNLQRNQAMLAQREAALRQGGASTGNVADVIGMLKARASGAAPSVAQTQLNQTTDANRRAALSLAASGTPGSNPALNLRTAINAGTQATQQAAGQGAELRATEQTQGEQNLVSAVQTQAGEENARNQLIQQYTAQGLSLDQAQFQAQQDLEKLKTSAYYGAKGLNLQAQQSNQAAGTNILGSTIGAIGSAVGGMMMSDKRVKMKVRSADADVKGMLDALPKYAAGGPVDVGQPLGGLPDYSHPDAIIGQALANTKPKPAESMSPVAQIVGKMIGKGMAGGPSTNGVNATGVGQNIGGYAEGGPIAGAGGPKDDRIPALLSNGENVWSADDVAKAGGQGGVEGIKQMLDQLHAQKFAYRGEGPDGEHLGIMAQDLEKSPLGRTMVMDTPAGKQVDVTMGMGALLAAAANLNKRMKAMESRGGERGGAHAR